MTLAITAVYSFGSVKPIQFHLLSDEGQYFTSIPERTKAIPSIALMEKRIIVNTNCNEHAWLGKNGLNLLLGKIAPKVSKLENSCSFASVFSREIGVATLEFPLNHHFKAQCPRMRRLSIQPQLCSIFSLNQSSRLD